MDVDQIPCTHRGERQGMKVGGDHLANTCGSSDRRGQRSVLSLLPAQGRVVFFQLHIGLVLLAGVNVYTTLDNLGPDAIQRTIPVAPVIVFVLGDGPSCMRQRIQGARDVYINAERLTTEPALDEVVSRLGIVCHLNQGIWTHVAPDNCFPYASREAA